MTTTASQSDRILEWMKSGKSITALEALREFGCFRLAARINDLKNDGHCISSEPFSYTNSFGETKTIAKYSVKKPMYVTDPHTGEQLLL